MLSCILFGLMCGISITAGIILFFYLLGLLLIWADDRWGDFGGAFVLATLVCLFLSTLVTLHCMGILK